MEEDDEENEGKEEDEEEKEEDEEEKEDEEEQEIEQIIRRTSHWLEDEKPARTIPQSCSVHANLVSKRRFNDNFGHKIIFQA